MSDTTMIGKNIEAIRTARNWSRAELSRRTGYKVGTIKSHEETGNMRAETILVYSETLGCKPEELLKDSINPEAFALTTDITSYYPWNLACAVYAIDPKEATDEEMDRIYRVYVPALNEAVKSLTDREQKVIHLRFKQGRNLEETANEFCVTRERIRQVEARALRKLRHPRFSRHFVLDTMDKAIEAKEECSRLELENIRLRSMINENVPEPEPVDTSMDIDDLELSVRSYNCLKRAGINKVSDLDGWTVEKMMRIRNLGRRSLDEVLAKLKEYGIEVKHENEY